MSDTHSNERASFLERLGRLAGRTSWKVPVEGVGTRLDQMPVEHHLAAALSYARGSNPHNPGPEIAYAFATGTPHGRSRVVDWLVAKLDHGTGAAGRRNAERMTTIALAAYMLMVFGKPTRNGSLQDRDAQLLISIGAGWLSTAMDATIERAERNQRTRAAA